MGCSTSSTSGSTSPAAGAPSDGGVAADPGKEAGAGSDGDAAALSSGCGAAVAKTGLLAPLAITAKGKPRVYHLVVPDGYDPKRAYPVVFVLHGATDTTPQDMHDWYDVHTYTPPALYVYPQALPRTHADGTGGLVTRWDVDGDEDLLFFDAMVAEIGRSFCTSAGRAFATGFSSGGNFAQQLACTRRSALLAVAPVAGPGPFSPTCDGPMPMWMTHDVNDDALPVSGARQSRDFWLKTNGCTKDLVEDSPAECKRGSTCPDSAPVTYCESTGVGHDVPPYAVKQIGLFFSRWF